MQMNYKVAGQFEHLYPVTLGDNVNLNSGQSLEQWKSYIEDLLNTIDNGQVEIWTGVNALATTGAGITVSKSLTSCKNGFILVFKPSNSSQNLNYCYVPKVHTPGGGAKFIVGGTEGSIYSKYIVINGTSIQGHANNGGANAIMELIKVIAH